MIARDSLVGARPDEPALLAHTTQALLCLGGDSRSHLTGSGLNRYGCRPYPRDAIAFGSCTASSPLPRVYEAAAAQHQRLRDAATRGELASEVLRSYRRVVDGLRHHLHLHRVPDLDVVLTPSGTDAEFVALLLALGDRGRALCNVVVGPREVGSGTEPAAAGLHFDAFAPHGQDCSKGTPVSEHLADLVEVRCVSLRDDDGCVREPEDLDGETEEIVARAVARGRRVLLHIVAHSKTGVHAPSLAAVRKLKHRYPGEVDVIVDAAQGRVSRRGLVDALDEGFLVLYTGSKFYGGPPFAGALFVPKEFDPRSRGVPPMSPGFSSYFSRWEFPDRWAGFTSNLTRSFNLGLLLRWVAALEAHRAYYEVPGPARFQVLRCFEDLVPDVFADSKRLSLDSVDPVHFPAGAERLLESKTTVFPFSVRVNPDDSRRHFRKGELARIADWLNRDISRLDADFDAVRAQLLSRRFHIGQPVFEGDDKHPAVLRLALGAALVTQVGLDTELGASLEERLAWLEAQVRGAVDKLEWVVGRYEQLVKAEDARVTT